MDAHRLAPGHARARAVRQGTVPGGESYHDATRRVDYFLHELAAAHPGERVLIGHTATRWALDHLLGGRGLDAAVAAPFDWREGWEYVLRDRAVTEAGVSGRLLWDVDTQVDFVHADGKLPVRARRASPRQWRGHAGPRTNA